MTPYILGLKRLRRQDMAVIKTKNTSNYGEIYFFEMLANEKTAIYGVKAK